MSGNIPSESHREALTASPAGDALRVQRSRGRDEYVLLVDGEADLATAALLGQALASASHHKHERVVLDIAGLQFIDAHCLGVISNARCLLREQDRELVLRSPPPLVRRLLTICEMDALIEA